MNQSNPLEIAITIAFHYYFNMFIGIDGCRGGWICSSIDNNKIEISMLKRIENIVNMPGYNNMELCLIDIPIGLPSNRHRTCDQEARKLLKERWRSVFYTPVRKAVYSKSYQEACTVNKTATDKKISIQVWNIHCKIKEVDRFIIKSGLKTIHESHPEICFLGFNGGNPCRFSKKKRDGVEERLQIIKREIPQLESEIKKTYKKFTRKEAGKDDIIDSAILLCTAMKNGNLINICDKIETDEKGLVMEILYYKDLDIPGYKLDY
jgi:8-oxo-dGTP diphosphatase